MEMNQLWSEGKFVQRNLYRFQFLLHFYQQKIEIDDLSIGYTETKNIKLNTKTQNIFCCVNENLTTFSYTLTGQKKQKEKKVFSFKVYTKVECYKK